MNTAKGLVALAIALALGTGQSFAATEKQEDSAYQWGRWSVLSPAAGGEPYVAVNTPGADFNARPGDASEFQPEVQAGDGGETPPVNPPVEVFCEAGSTCGFATYTRQEGDSGESNGPVLTDFELTESKISDPNNDNQVTVSADVTEFAVSGAEDQATFPDVNSVPILGKFVGGSDDIQTTVGNVVDIDENLQATTNLTTSTLSHNNQDTGEPLNFEGVETGYWEQLAQQRVADLLTDEGETRTLSESNGYFVQGVTATVEQMNTFIAGRGTTAVYNGLVLDYSSPVALNFNFGSNTFNGNFSTANGFNGFQINGAVDGVNFGASDAGKTVNGSFFNGGLNASGAVNNGSQRGVFSTDLVN